MDRTTLLYRLLPSLTSLLIMLSMVGFYLSDGNLSKSLRDRLGWIIYDMRMVASLNNTEVSQQDLPVTIIDIDEAALAEYGHWPWPRDVLAKLTDKLMTKGVVLVSYDILFAEEQNQAANLIRQYQQQLNDPEQTVFFNDITEALDGDKRFADTIAQHEVVLSIVFSQGDFTKGLLSHPLNVNNGEDTFIHNMPKMKGYISNTPALSEAARYIGFINAHPDSDGIMRRARLIQYFNGDIYPSLSLASSMGYLLADEVELHSEVIGDQRYLQALQLFDQVIPIDSQGDVLIPYLGPAFTFPYVSAKDVLNDTADEALLQGKIALIGSTAASLSDFRATPTNSLYPGVEAHANVISGIINNHFYAKPEWTQGINFVLIVSVGVLLAFLLPLLSPAKQLLCVASVLAAIVGFDYWLWISQNFIIDSVVPILSLLLIGIFNMAYGFIINSRDRIELKAMFGQYVPPQLVDEMSKKPGEFAMDGERKEMTVLFSDIRNFTSISEGLSAAKLKQWLNTYFTPITEIIFNHQGTIDKYVGDMVMAFWGAPLDDSDHALHAVVAAQKILAETETLNKQFEATQQPSVAVGIGISSGEMNVGNMGSKYRRSYTVIGDTVNLGSRLEGLTKFYGVSLITSERTRNLIGDRMTFRLLDRVKVKGKDDAVNIYEPVQNYSNHRLKDYHFALEKYFEGDFRQAHRLFERLLKQEPSSILYQLYKDRCLTLSKEDPADWQGVFTHKSK